METPLSNGEKSSFPEFTEEEIRRQEKDRDAFWFSQDAFEEHKILFPISWKDINRSIFPEAQWRIKNLIPLQGMITLSAVSGGKKSWVALEMARCIVQGRNFLDREEFATIKGKVLYVDSENAKSEIQRRGRQLLFDDRDDFFVLSLDNLNLNDKDTADEIKSSIERNKIDTVFIDTFRAVAGSLKEEKAEEVRAFFNRFKSLKDKGVSIVFLDHFKKTNPFEGKTPKKDFLLGSIDKGASVEVLLMLQSESGSPEILMYQRKNRLAKEINPFKMQMMDEVIEGKINTIFKYDGEIVDDLCKKDEAKELLYNLLSGSQSGMGTKEILAMTQKEVGQKNTRRALRELTDEGILECVKHGKENYYYFSENSENQPKIEKESIDANEQMDFFDSS